MKKGKQVEPANNEVLAIDKVEGETVQDDNAMVTGIEDLPEELIRYIISMVTDASTLDSLRLVCRWWNRVISDPVYWAAHKFRFDFGEKVPKSVKDRRADNDHARILLRAPAASLLELREEMHSPCAHCRRVKSAVRRSRAMVRKLDCVCSSETFWEHVAPFLYRQQGLRALRLSLDREQRLRLAEEPDQEGVPTAVDGRYDGELAGRLPELRELRLHQRDRSVRLPDGLVGDLVRGAAALRVLSVDLPPRGADRDACAALRSVEHVELVLKAESAAQQARATAEATRLCAAMGASLRTATLSLHRRAWHSMDDGLRRDETELPVWHEQVRRDFAVQLPKVKLNIEMRKT